MSLIDISNPSKPTLKGSKIEMQEGAVPNSVAISGDVLAIAADAATNATDPGSIHFYRLPDGTPLTSVSETACVHLLFDAQCLLARAIPRGTHDTTLSPPTLHSASQHTAASTPTPTTAPIPHALSLYPSHLMPDNLCPPKPIAPFLNTGPGVCHARQHRLLQERQQAVRGL